MKVHDMLQAYERLTGLEEAPKFIPSFKELGISPSRLSDIEIEQGTPLPVISEILGHFNSKSTSDR